MIFQISMDLYIEDPVVIPLPSFRYQINICL